MDADTKIDLVLIELKKICEQIDDKFEHVNERFDQIDKRFEQVDAKFDQIDAKFDQIDARFEQIDAKFEQIDKRLDNMDRRIEENGKRIDNFSTEIGALHRTLFKLDVDTQENYRILSNAIKAHTDKEILFEKQLYRLTDQLDNTTFRVSILEDSLINS